MEDNFFSAAIKVAMIKDPYSFFIFFGLPSKILLSEIFLQVRVGLFDIVGLIVQ